MFKIARWYTLILIFISLTSNAQQIKFVGSADKKFDGNKIVIYIGSFVDSAVIRGGKFNFNVPFTGPAVYHFYSTLEKANGWNYPLGIMVTNPGTVAITADVEHFKNTKVSGSKENELYQAFCLKIVQADQAKMDELYKKYGKEMVNNRHLDTANANVKKLNQDYERLNRETDKKQMESLKQLIHTHPDAYASMYFLQGYGSELNLSDYESLYNSLSPNYKNTPAGKFIASDIKEKKTTDIGHIAPDFAAPDTAGNMIKLSSFRGNYVLLDFWASWCVPCRAENPNVVKAFNKFKDKGFTVLSFSLDQPGKKEAWLKAIHHDGLTWTHISDLKFWDSKVVALYGIKGIPANFLLDKEGKIIAKDLTGADLDNKLAELLEKH